MEEVELFFTTFQKTSLPQEDFETTLNKFVFAVDKKEKAMEFLPCIIRTNSFCSVTIRFCAVYICEKLLHSLKALFLVRRGKLERKMASLCPAGYCQKVRKERIESIYLLTTSNKLVDF